MHKMDRGNSIRNMILTIKVIRVRREECRTEQVSGNTSSWLKSLIDRNLTNFLALAGRGDALNARGKNVESKED